MPPPPSGDGTLTLTGLDDELPAKATIEVAINGVPIYSGPSPFPNWDGNMADQGANAAWAEATFPIPAGLLLVGTNDLGKSGRPRVASGHPDDRLVLGIRILARSFRAS